MSTDESKETDNASKNTGSEKKSHLSSDIFQLWLAASPAVKQSDNKLQINRPERDYESLEVR